MPPNVVEYRHFVVRLWSVCGLPRLPESTRPINLGSTGCSSLPINAEKADARTFPSELASTQAIQSRNRGCNPGGEMSVTEKPAQNQWVYDRPDAETMASGHVLLTIRVREEGGSFVGECVELDISSCGDDVNQAFPATLEATALYPERLDVNGERDWVLPKRRPQG